MLESLYAASCNDTSYPSRVPAELTEGFYDPSLILATRGGMDLDIVLFLFTVQSPHGGGTDPKICCVQKMDPSRSPMGADRSISKSEYGRVPWGLITNICNRKFQLTPP